MIRWTLDPRAVDSIARDLGGRQWARLSAPPEPPRDPKPPERVKPGTRREPPRKPLPPRFGRA